MLKILLVVACITPFVWPVFANAEVTSAEAAKSLPDKIGSFRARGPASLPANGFEETIAENAVISNAARSYSSINGNTFLVYITKTRMDSAAYSLLTKVRRLEEIRIGDVGTASIVGSRWVFFFKGDSFVKVLQSEGKVSATAEIDSLARGLAEQLDGGESDIPVLVKHLPSWETVQPHASYAVSLEGLKRFLPGQPVLDSVSFEGAAEAVVANYDSGKLLIIEFNTARIAGDNDWNIRTEINELRGPNQPVGTATPTAYRRVGNYAVFVFDAPDEQAANQLIDQVKYQQVVQWLGENPYLYEDAQREFVETTLGVFVAVVKGSGLALVTCFAVGGFLGGLLFIRRRAQQRAVEAYSDAGGMVRLNLDEMTAQTDPARLLRR